MSIVRNVHTRQSLGSRIEEALDTMIADGLLDAWGTEVDDDDGHMTYWIEGSRPCKGYYPPRDMSLGTHGKTASWLAHWHPDYFYHDR